MAVTGLLASCIEQPTVSGARASLNIAVVKCASLALNNMALVVGTPAFASLLGALLPATTYGVERLLRRDPTTPPLGVCAACVGAMLLVRGELSCTIPAAALVLGSCVCRSLRTVWSYDFMRRELQSPFRLAAWTAIWCFVIMVPVTLVKEGQQEPIAAFWGLGFWTKIVFLVGGVLSAGLNMLMCYVLKFLGPLPQNIYGQLELVLVLTLSVSWYQEYMGVIQWTGASLISLACVLIRPGASSSFKDLNRNASARGNEQVNF
jgi:drug/metabolite transporter (DMT)-like permease